MLPKIRHITFDFHMSQSPQSLWSVFQSLINICCHILHIRFLGNLVLTERKERNWPEKEPRHQSFASLATLTTAQVDPLTSTARAPELWCPPIFFGVFLMVYSHLCWQCSNKNRKNREHINTLGKKDKLIFLMPILKII